MDKYSVKLNKRAFKDIDNIFEYIALEKLSPENQERIINDAKYLALIKLGEIAK